MAWEITREPPVCPLPPEVSELFQPPFSTFLGPREFIWCSPLLSDTVLSWLLRMPHLPGSGSLTQSPYRDEEMGAPRGEASHLKPRSWRAGLKLHVQSLYPVVSHVTPLLCTTHGACCLDR